MLVLTLIFIIFSSLNAQNSNFNGLDLNLGNLYRLSKAKTRSISAENFTGEKGMGGMATEGTGKNAARELGQGWKISPAVKIAAGETFTVAEIEGPGAIQQIWMTPRRPWRSLILRFYWDGEEHPSIEVPVGDFFACGWGEYAHVNSLSVIVNPGSGFNSFWVMPFRKSCKITMENIGSKETTLFYQVNYTLTEVPEDAAYFHAQFRRTNPLNEGGVFTILDGVEGWGHYVGTYMCWGSNSKGWWGEGEIKFYLDGDEEFPTVCGTGTEDYFLGSYGFVVDNKYETFTTAYAGMPQVITPDGLWNSQQRFGLYRWHVMDPIRFEKNIKVAIQALGWKSEGRYALLHDDISSVAYWYQLEPHKPFPYCPPKDALEID